MKKIFAYLVILGSAAVFYIVFASRTPGQPVIDLPPAVTSTEILSNANINSNTASTTTASTTPPAPIVVAPDKINLAVPFTSQAPTANWDQPWQDACEEASILMVDYFWRNQALPDKQELDQVLADMIQWQVDNWGVNENLTIARLAEYVKINFNYQTEIIEDINVEKIKYYLRQGKPLIVPANGKKLNNPNFRNGGPEYHMLVIKGFVDNYFITNDPGTRLGKDYLYTYQNLLSAIADWNQNEARANGPQKALLVY